jgi:hypothetical protein
MMAGGRKSPGNWFDNFIFSLISSEVKVIDSEIVLIVIPLLGGQERPPHQVALLFSYQGGRGPGPAAWVKLLPFSGSPGF